MGSMGRAWVTIAKALGAREISVDMIHDRLGVAKEPGADHVINGGEASVLNEIARITHAENIALYCVRAHGRVAL